MAKRKAKQGKPRPPRPAPPSQRPTWVKKSHFTRNLIIAIFVIALIGGGVYALSTQQGPVGQPITITNSAWKTAPLTDPQTGQTFSLSQYSGKVIVLELMATWCSACQAEQQQLQTVEQNLNGNSQVVLIDVDVDQRESATTLATYIQTNHFGSPNGSPQWRYGVDSGQLLQSIAGNVGVNGFVPATPTYVIDKQQSNSFTFLQRNQFQVSNSASDIMTAIQNALKA